MAILALVCHPSVTMPAWAPVREMAWAPRACSAMARSAMVVCSPVDNNTSISRSTGSGWSCLASSISESVTPFMADTATTTW